MKKFFLTGFAILLLQLGFGQIPSGYYDSATGTGYTLKTQLYNIIDGHTSVSYTPGLWDAFYTTDDRSDGYVWDTYSNCDFIFGTDQDNGTEPTDECTFYNREHSFPREWFGGAVAPMNTDIFHIYPTSKVVNSARASLPYGETNSPTFTSINGSKVGPSSYSGYTGTVFEPIDEYKGDFARTYFYMVTRYENVISSWPGSAMLDGSNDKCFTDWALEMLIQWSNTDPVSQKEIDRNNAIYAIQNNRNPFIDHPEYVAQIWGGSGNMLPSITNIVKTPSSPTSGDAVNISATITDSDGSISSAELHWGLTSGILSNTITMSVSSGTTFITNTGIPAQANGTTVYFEIKATDNEAANTQTAEYSYSVNIPENENPVISGLEYNPSTPTSSENVNVSVTITDSDGTISSANIKWGTTSGVYENTVSMSVSVNVYTGAIPAQADATHVYFVVEANDNSGGSATSSEQDYIVANPANEPPGISDVQYSPTSPTNLDSVLVSATVTDTDGTIASVLLKWKRGSEVTIYEKSMALSESLYKAYIPAQEAGKTIYFMITATDNDNAEDTYLDGTYIVSTSSSSNMNPDLNNLQIFPNPVKDKLTIKLPVNCPEITISLFNILGNEIVNETIRNYSEDYIVYFSDKPKGVYFLNISINGKKITKKIIVN